MPFVAHYLVTAASLDQQIEAWLLNPLLMVLLLMMLILALLEMPLFYAGLLLVLLR